MPLGYHKDVPIGYRILIPDRDTESVRNQHVAGGNCAKRASLFVSIVFASHRPEVGVVAVSFHRVATEAECLEIANIVCAALISRRDVIHF
jgi:hypothetical protein